MNTEGMIMKRRNHFGRVGLALVLSLTMIWSACSTEWIGEAEQIVAALIPAASNIVALVAALDGKSVSAGDLAAIQNAGAQAGADLQLIQSLIAAYQKADEAAKPGSESDSECDWSCAGKSARTAAGTAHKGCGYAG